MRKITPHTLRKLTPRDGMIDIPIHRPLDRLGRPVPTRAVPLEPPDVRALVRDADARAQARVPVVVVALGAAVHGAVPRRRAVDRLEDVELAARRPRQRAGAERLREHPEGRPEPLLGRRGVAAEIDLGLGARDDARRGRPRPRGLDAARGPPVRGRGVGPRDELQRAAARELHVLAGGGVLLELGVHAEVARDDVPVAGAGGRAGGADEGGVPDEGVAGVGWGCDGCYRREGACEG